MKKRRMLTRLITTRTTSKTIASIIWVMVSMLAGPVYAEQAFKLDIIEVAPRQFNPSGNEQAKIKFRSERDGQALVRFYDRRAYQVREFAVEHIAANETVTVAWNGKDDQGRVVPNEAYFFTIEATDIQGNQAEYDPTIDLKPRFTPMLVNYDSGQQKLSFTVDQDSVLDVRSGVSDGGPLLVKLIEWKPFLQGDYSIDWDGWDKAHTVQTASLPNHQLYSQILPLPPNSILTVGNPDGQEDIYSLIYPQKDLKRKSSTEFADKRFSQADASPYKHLSPVFNFDFNDVISTDNDLPVLRDKGSITLRLQESVKQRVTETRYEILLFVDFKFVTEIEEGRSPAKMNIDMTNLASGEHVLTVNLVTLQGGLATLSKRFMKKTD